MTSTALTEMFGLQHPIVLAPMRGVSGGRLAAAVSNAGGLGLTGAGYGDRVSEEALGHDRAKQRIAAADGDQTRRTTVFDIVRELAWPAPYTGRGLCNRFIECWHGRERELAAVLDTERDAYQTATREGDIDTAVVWAGEAVDLIVGVERAAMLVQRISAQAEQLLALGASLAQGRRAASTRETRRNVAASNGTATRSTGGTT